MMLVLIDDLEHIFCVFSDEESGGMLKGRETCALLSLDRVTLEDS